MLELIKRTLRNTRGAIDMGSVLVGVVVVGIAGGAITASTLAIVPWAQDSTAKSALTAVSVAQSGVEAQTGAYLGYSELVADGRLKQHNGLAVATDDDGTCFVAAAFSESGHTFVATSLEGTPFQYAGDSDGVAWCDGSTDVIEAVAQHH